jgi:sulfite dehydrogenase (cytochrome) subunit B
MKRSMFLMLGCVTGLTAGVYGAELAAVKARPISYQLPADTTAFKPGPNLEVVQNNCTACHSADYIHIQPRGPKFKRDFWQAEVTKMIKVYGAPIAEADIGKIVDYLAQTY